MKNSILEIREISSKQIIQKDQQLKVKGGVHLIKMCDLGFGRG